MTQRTLLVGTALAAVALLQSPPRGESSWEGGYTKEQEVLQWSLSAAARCPKVDARYLDGTCVQLVSKVAGGLIQGYVPDSGALVKALLEIHRCERGKGRAGGIAPFLASCVERNGAAAARGFEQWRELRAKAPDVPKEVPNAVLPQGDSLFRQ